jgi:predicted  nucleic acid-binding Zn-ribbon protein
MIFGYIHRVKRLAMNPAVIMGIIFSFASAVGCVSEETYLTTQRDAEKARQALAQQTAALDTLKNQGGREKQELAEALEQAKARAASDLSALKNELSATQTSLTTAQQALESIRREVESTKSTFQEEHNRREALEAELKKLQNARELRDTNERLQRDQTSLRADIEHLQQLLQSS